MEPVVGKCALEEDLAIPGFQIFGLKKNPTGTLSDLKSEVVETVSKVKETKEKVNNINQEVDEINETLKNS